MEQKSLVSTNTALSNIFLNIPENIKSVLILSDGDGSRAVFGRKLTITINISSGLEYSNTEQGDDPSTIFKDAIIGIQNDEQLVDDLGYYPTYAGMDPYQRYKYLKWLTNIENPIDIGYVFVFYYGLEKHLLVGKFDEAFDLITNIRKTHLHKSFLAYSANALLASSIIHKRTDRINELRFLLNDEIFRNEHILIKYYLKDNLSAIDIVKILLGISEVNKRYLKTKLKEYIEQLNEELQSKYGSFEYPLQKQSINEIPKRAMLAFANIAFPENIRSLEMPNFIGANDFLKELLELHNNCHDKVKKQKK
jgi:hypothetical protein